MSEQFWQVANAVLDILDVGGMRPSAALKWLTSPCDDLGSDSPVDRIEQQDVLDVVAAARREAAAPKVLRK
jgi:hypothetical protein